MSYHYKDIYRILIPGIILYLVLQCMFPCVIKAIKSTLGFDSNNFNVFYVFFIPIAGFLLGFVNNFLSALIENKISYKKCYRRPSLRLLRNNNKFIRINSEILKQLYSKLLDKEIKFETKADRQSISEFLKGLDNNKAYRYFTKANQSIKDRSIMIESNFNYMIFARNIRIPMFFLFIETLLYVIMNSNISALLATLLLILSTVFMLILPWCMWQWYSLQHTKHIFAEYVKEE